jgi:hypothetical protein
VLVWASLVSYDLTAPVLKDFLPVEATLNAMTVQDEEDTYVLRDAVVRELERLKWFLWHGNVYRALQVVESVEMDLDVAVATGESTARKLRKAIVRTLWR